MWHWECIVDQVTSCQAGCGRQCLCLHEITQEISVGSKVCRWNRASKICFNGSSCTSLQLLVSAVESLEAAKHFEPARVQVPLCRFWHLSVTASIDWLWQNALSWCEADPQPVLLSRVHVLLKHKTVTVQKDNKALSSLNSVSSWVCTNIQVCDSSHWLHLSHDYFCWR